MVERSDELDLPRQKHPVSEHVAAHVPDAHDGERFGLNVLPLLTEMALDALPRATGGNPDRLVVVSPGPPRCERVPQPESVVGGQRVGHIGVPSRALIGSNYQVRIGSVPADDILGGNRGAVDV